MSCKTTITDKPFRHGRERYYIMPLQDNLSRNTCIQNVARSVSKLFKTQNINKKNNNNKKPSKNFWIKDPKLLQNTVTTQPIPTTSYCHRW